MPSSRISARVEEESAVTWRRVKIGAPTGSGAVGDDLEFAVLNRPDDEAGLLDVALWVEIDLAQDRVERLAFQHGRDLVGIGALRLVDGREQDIGRVVAIDRVGAFIVPV